MKYIWFFRIGLFFMLVIPTGCQTISAPTKTAALLDKSSANCRKQLQQTLKIFTGGNVTIAPDALTNTSTLILEHAQISDLSGAGRDGMLLEKPVSFRLWQIDAACILENERSGEQGKLSECNCRPAK